MSDGYGLRMYARSTTILMLWRQCRMTFRLCLESVSRSSPYITDMDRKSNDSSRGSPLAESSGQSLLRGHSVLPKGCHTDSQPSSECVLIEEANRPEEAGSFHYPIKCKNFLHLFYRIDRWLHSRPRRLRSDITMSSQLREAPVLNSLGAKNVVRIKKDGIFAV